MKLSLLITEVTRNDTIPVVLEEAARIDGCTAWQTFYQVILLLAAPALVITA